MENLNYQIGEQFASFFGKEFTPFEMLSLINKFSVHLLCLEESEVVGESQRIFYIKMIDFFNNSAALIEAEAKAGNKIVLGGTCRKNQK